VCQGQVNLYPHLRSEYARLAREVQTIAYALAGFEASVSRETDFPCEVFRIMIRSLSEASTEAQARISAMERGKYSVIGFDADYNRCQSPSPKQEKQGKKWKQRDDHYKSRAGSPHGCD